MQKLKGYLALLFGVAALSTSAIFVRLAQAPASVTAFYRLLFALVVLWPAVLCSASQRQALRQLTGRQLMLSMVSGLLLAIHYILWFESLNYTSVASSTVIVTLQPIFSILLALIFLREKQKPAALLGCLIAIGGSCVIGCGDFQTGSRALLGDLMALLAAMFISGHFFFGQMLRKDLSAALYTALGYSASVFFLLIYGLLHGDAFTGYAPKVWGCFLGLALISTLLGQFLFNHLLRWLSATTISTGILGEPVGTCILAHLILHETITLRQTVGMVIILGGLILYFVSPSLKKQKA